MAVGLRVHLPEEAFQLHSKGMSQDQPEGGKDWRELWPPRLCVKGFHFPQVDAMILVWVFLLVK